MDYSLTQYGIFGLIIATMAAVIVYQNRKVETLYKEKDALQEKRFADKAETADKYNEVMGEFSRTSELLYRKLGGEK